MLELALYGPVGTDDNQLLQFMPGPRVLPLLTLQSGCLPSYNNVIDQCGKWHHHNDRLLLSYSCY